VIEYYVKEAEAVHAAFDKMHIPRKHFEQPLSMAQRAEMAVAAMRALWE
jgi:hypothetical protein